MHPDDHRPRRPRPRSDLRVGHDGLRRRAVGPALDHDRHLARRAGARPRAASWARAIRTTSSPTRATGSEGSRDHAQGAVHRAGAGGHPPRLRLRARAARHAEVDRQQCRDRRHLGEVAGDAGAAAREAERRRSRRRGRSGRSRARRTPTGPTRRRSCTPTGGRRASRGRRRSTPRSPPRPSSSTSTTGPTRTRRRSASPGRSRSRACRRTACSAWTRTTSSSTRSREADAEYGHRAVVPADDPGEPADRRRAAGAQGRQDHFTSLTPWPGELRLRRGALPGRRRHGEARRDLHRPGVRHRHAPRPRRRRARGGRRRLRRAHRLRLQLRGARHRVQQARPHARAQGADERRPAHGRRPEEHRQGQPVRHLRRAGHRRCSTPGRARSG